MAGSLCRVGSVGRLSDEQVRTWVEASCRAQGIAVGVTDPRVVGQVATLLGGRVGPPARRASAEEGPALGSEAPVSLDSGRVKAS